MLTTAKTDGSVISFAGHKPNWIICRAGEPSFFWTGHFAQRGHAIKQRKSSSIPQIFTWKASSWAPRHPLGPLNHSEDSLHCGHMHYISNLNKSETKQTLLWYDNVLYFTTESCLVQLVRPGRSFYSSFPLSSLSSLWQNSVVILLRLELHQSTHRVTDSLLSTLNRPNLMTLIWSLLEAQSLATTCSRYGCTCVGGGVAPTRVYFIDYVIIKK